MSITSYTSFLKAIIPISHGAGKLVMKYHGKVTESYKTKYTDAAQIYSKADLESEKYIVKQIKKHFPTHGIYGEEKERVKLDAEYVWYVDPIDGSANFIRNIPLFGISIGLLHHGKPVVGVLYFPALELTVYASKGKGAFANGKKIHVSNRDFGESMYHAGGLYKKKFQFIPALALNMGMYFIINASSYELAHIAMGGAELYVLENVPHDVAAGIIIVQEAGGKVTDGKGKPWTLSSKEIVASNRKIHAEVIRLLAQRVKKK